METSGFFNSMTLENGEEDREYSSIDFASYFSNFIGNGVFMEPVNQLLVEYTDEGTAYQVKVRKGKAFVKGYWYELDEDLLVEIPKNLTAYEVTNSIVIEFNITLRKMYLKVLEDVNSGEPIRTEGIYQLVVALIKVAPASSKLEAEKIIDTRSNSNYCGFVTGLVEQIDLTDLFTQYQNAINSFEAWSYNEFEEWFEKIKGQLSTDAAGALQLEVDTLQETKVSFTNILSLEECNATTIEGQYVADAKAVSDLSAMLGTQAVLNLSGTTLTITTL